MNDIIKCSECGAENDFTAFHCSVCGEILPIPDDECDACTIDFSADEINNMFGGD